MLFRSWQAIAKVVNMGQPAPTGRYLGCDHAQFDAELDISKAPCVGLPTFHPHPEGTASIPCRVLCYNMTSFIDSCCTNYEELCGAEFKGYRKADTPFIDEATFSPREDKVGRLAPIALKVLMKNLYAARMSRFDLLRPLCMLAKYVDKWSADCDSRLHKVMCYMNGTKSFKTYAY